jgi:hypothetical protein
MHHVEVKFYFFKLTIVLYINWNCEQKVIALFLYKSQIVPPYVIFCDEIIQIVDILYKI